MTCVNYGANHYNLGQNIYIYVCVYGLYHRPRSAALRIVDDIAQFVQPEAQLDQVTHQPHALRAALVRDDHQLFASLDGVLQVAHGRILQVSRTQYICIDQYDLPRLYKLIFISDLPENQLPFFGDECRRNRLRPFRQLVARPRRRRDGRLHWRWRNGRVADALASDGQH